MGSPQNTTHTVANLVTLQRVFDIQFLYINVDFVLYYTDLENNIVNLQIKSKICKSILVILGDSMYMLGIWIQYMAHF